MLDVRIEHIINITQTSSKSIEQNRKQLSRELFGIDTVPWKDITTHLLVGIQIISRTIRVTNGIEELHV